MIKNNLTFMLLIFTGVLLYFVIFDGERSNLIGQMPPYFTVLDENDHEFKLADHMGKNVVILNFWATWCPPCRSEIPILNLIKDETAGQNVKIVAVMVDDLTHQAQKKAALESFVQKVPINFDVVFDDSFRVADMYGTHVLPETFLIDLKGVVRYKHAGPISSHDKKYIVKKIEALLNQTDD